jgi:hypothetical protein
MYKQTQQNKPRQRVLQECFIHAYDAKYLNHNLQQVKVMIDRAANADSMQSFMQFIDRVIHYNTAVYKLYALLVAIVVVPEFAVGLRQHDDTTQFDRFYHILEAELTNFLAGRRPDGSLFEKDAAASDIYQAHPGYFVDRMRQHYMYEEPIQLTTTLPSSKPIVHIAQSLAAPPPHGSIAVNRV